MNVHDLHLEHKHYALAERGITPKHFREIWRLLREFLKFAELDKIEQISTSQIRNFLIHGRLELGWSAKTFQNYRQYLRSFFEWTRRQGYTKSNPVDAIEKPKLDQRIPRSLSRNDARKVLFCATWYPWRSTFEKSRNPTILATFLMTGLRLQELINLKTPDIDLATGQITVWKGKGRKDRLVPIHHRLNQQLRGYLKIRAKKQSDGDHLFPGITSGKELQPRDIRSICRKVGREAKVKLTPHMLRHTFAREMVENDFPLYKLKEILGHANITTTQIYLSVSHASIKKSFDSVSMY
jgi:site-specific recombinase XerD